MEREATRGKDPQPQRWRMLPGSDMDIWEFPQIRGTFSGGPNNKDYSILGSILGDVNY